MPPTHMSFIHAGHIKYYEFAAMSNHFCLFLKQKSTPNTHTYFTQLMNSYRPGGFQKVKVPRFRDNGTGWW